MDYRVGDFIYSVNESPEYRLWRLTPTEITKAIPEFGMIYSIDPADDCIRGWTIDQVGKNYQIIKRELAKSKIGEILWN